MHTHENSGVNQLIVITVVLCRDLSWSDIQQRLLGRVGEEEAHKASPNEQGGHSKDRNGTGCLDKVAENEVAKDGPKPGGHQRDCHGS